MSYKPRKRFRKRKYSDTGIEKKTAAALNKLGIEYRKQEWIGRIAPVDFYVPDSDLIIEADGCYWHGCPTHFPNRNKRKQAVDKIRNNVYTQLGFKVLRIWEHDINAWTIDELSDHIKNKL
jgi:DNA mismatch endonuclease (patch repair protein)